MKTQVPSQSQLRLFLANNFADDGDEFDPRPEILCYRGQTLAIVRHFFEISSQVGRLPSLLGREFFHARVSHHGIPSFEDQAVFVRDVELCFSRLSESHAEMITLVGLYSFSRDEVAEMLHASKSWVSNRVAEALDALSEIFLQARLLREDRPDRRHIQVMSRSLQHGVAVAVTNLRKPTLTARQPSADQRQLPA